MQENAGTFKQPREMFICRSMTIYFLDSYPNTLRQALSGYCFAQVEKTTTLGVRPNVSAHPPLLICSTICKSNRHLDIRFLQNTFLPNSFAIGVWFLLAIVKRVTCNRVAFSHSGRSADGGEQNLPETESSAWCHGMKTQNHIHEKLTRITANEKGHEKSKSMKNLMNIY